MIHIEERQTNKMPGLSSLFVSFDYNKDIVEAIKTLPNYTYDKKTYTWEIPTTSLADLINKLNKFDDIDLKFMSDAKVQKDIKFELSEFKYKPFGHQEEAIQYGLNHDNFLLLDAPGLGKSLSAMYLAEELKKRENIEHCLIICGINTLKMNWRKEIQKFSSESCRILGEKVSKKGKYSIGSINDRIADLKRPLDEFFLITNIESLRNENLVNALNTGPNKIDMVVFDELHCAKNPTSAQSKGLIHLKGQKHKLGMTGTLITNSPLDCYLPLKWLGIEHGTFTNFKFYYCSYAGQFNDVLIGYKNTDILHDMINSCSLRRTKDLLNLPPKNIIHEDIEMEPDQIKFYNNIVQGIVDEVDKVKLDPAMVLSMTIRLRQAISCPSILTTENISSSKISRACDLAKQIVSNDEKVVIFSAFKPTLDELAKQLSEYNPLLCTGDVKDEIISENIDKFQNDQNYKIILATVQKMGTGITLTAATNEIFIDTAWTHAQNLQCEDRIYRVGSTKPVFIYYLWNTGTIDERVRELVESKEAVSDFVIDGACPQHLAVKLKKIILDLKS